MAEDAKLHIILTEQGGGISAGPPASNLRPNNLLDAAMGLTPPPAAAPPPDLTPASGPAPLDLTPPPPPPPRSAADDFDPVAEARRLLEMEEKRQQVQEARLQILKEEGKLKEDIFDPVVEAQRALELEERRQKVQEARLAILKEQGKLQEDVFYPVAQAEKLLETEGRRRQVEEARLRLVAERANRQGPGDVLDPNPPPFDPRAEAQKRIEAEKRKHQIEAAYLNQTEGPADVKGPGFTLPPQLQQLANAAGVGGLAQAAGEFATAAGPAGVALGAVALVSHQVAGNLDAMRRQVELAGTALGQFAGNDHMGMFTSGVDMAAASLERVPIVGDALAAGLKATVAPLIAFNRVVEAFVHRGDELAQFSGTITAAQVRADMRSMMADIREAEALGPGIARLTDATSQLWIELREILLPIKQFLVETLAGIMEFLRDGIMGLQMLAADIKLLLQMIWDKLTFASEAQKLDRIVKYAERIAEIMARAQDQQGLGEQMDAGQVLKDMQDEVKDWLRQQPAAPPIPDANAGPQHAPVFDAILAGGWP